MGFFKSANYLPQESLPVGFRSSNYGLLSNPEILPVALNLFQASPFGPHPQTRLRSTDIYKQLILDIARKTKIARL